MCDYIYARAPFTCAERVSVQAGVNTCIRCECSDTLGARPPSGSETHCALRAPPRLMSLSHKPPSRRALSFAKSETWENICRRERASERGCETRTQVSPDLWPAFNQSQKAMAPNEQYHFELRNAKTVPRQAPKDKINKCSHRITSFLDISLAY
jgi:hypothetical protein